MKRLWSNKALLLCGVTMVLTGCQHVSVKKDQCEQTIRVYNRMVRWQEIEPAEKAVTAQLREDFRKTFANENLHIADYRIKSLSCDVDKGEAEAVVELDYYLTPSATMNTIEDSQKWRHFPDAIPGGWRLITPPPDFSPKPSK